MKRLDEKHCRHALPTSDDDLEIAAYHRMKEDEMDKHQDWVEHLTTLRGDVALAVSRAEKNEMNGIELEALRIFRRRLDEAHDALIDLVGFAEERREKETV